MADSQIDSDSLDELHGELSEELREELGDQIPLDIYVDDSEPLYHVMLDTPDLLDLNQGAQVLVDVLGLHKLDAKRTIRRGRGGLIEKLTKYDAERLVQALKEAGREAYMISHYELVNFPKKQRITYARVGNDQIHLIHHLTLKRESFDWDEIFYINIGMVPSEYFTKFIDSDDFRQMPVIQRVDDPELRDYYKEKLGQKALSRQLHMRKAIHKSARQQSKSRSKEDPEAMDQEDEEDFLRKLERATECYIDFIILNPTRYFRIIRSDLRLDFMPVLEENAEREDDVRYRGDYANAGEYFIHLVWLIYEHASKARTTFSTKNLLLFQPWKDVIFCAREYFDQFTELFLRIFDPDSDLFYRLVGTPEMQEVFRKRALPEEVLSNIEWTFKEEDRKFETLKSVAELILINAPCYRIVFGHHPEYDKFVQMTKDFLLKTTLKEIFDHRQDEYNKYKELSSKFIFHVSFDDLLYDSLDEYETINQWYVQRVFEDLKRQRKSSRDV
ncbi:hypothetical protein ACFL54_07100 [Planctomycetota bacterium]